MLLNTSKLKHEHYSEIGQNRPNFFAFATVDGDTVYQMHNWIKCRDFLNDTIVWSANKDKSNSSIYGYSYKGPIEEETTFVLKDSTELLDNIKLLNSMLPPEIKKSKVKNIDGQHILIIGDPFWQKNTVNLSWYTYLIRMFTYKLSCVEDVFQTSDPWIKNNPIKPAFFKMNKALLKLKGPVRGAQTSNMHDSNGFFTALSHPELGVNVYGKQLKDALSSV